MLLKRKYLFGTTILAGVMAVTAPAFAQQLPGVTVQGQSDQEATEIDEVVITGSRIRRDPTNSPTPLIQVSREDLLESGQSTVIDYLATIPALSNSQVPSDTTGALGIAGLSLANLRSLGTGRTLTLIDGRRQVGSQGGSLAVDTDTIPRLLIENIEIVTGGASSVYGADAVSGVLNFVLRKDFEGVEIDANYAHINQGGQQSGRVSALAGINLFDDRLNVWGFAEYENIQEVAVLDIDWYARSPSLVGVDADPAIGSPNGPVSDGIFDNQLFTGLRQLQIPRWGQTTLANSAAASPLNDPDVPFAGCTDPLISAAGSGARSAALRNANCFAINPGRTWVFEGATARLADFGQRIGNVGLNRTLNVGGDGDNRADFGGITRVPESESQRFSAGFNLDITSNIRFSADAKYITEDSFFVQQPTFFDFHIADFIAANSTNNATASNAFFLRLDDTAYLPSNLRSAIQLNTVQNFSAPTVTTGGLPTTAYSAPFARHTMFGPDRTQTNSRELTRYTAELEGDLEQLLFVKNLAWSLSYVTGVVEVTNTDTGIDNQRMQLGSDAVVDTAGVVNGRPGEIVCRAKLLRAQNPANVLADSFRGGDLRSSAEGLDALNDCVPINVFGRGNQSAAALDYITATITPTQKNEQEQAIAFVAGELWDFWGAGPIGVAVGAEYRREYTEALGRSTGTGDRFLFLNTGADFLGAEYESEEYFAELAVPLFQDTWLGEYAELSGSYRTFDYTTAGKGDVYGVNLVYRPIPDITIKTSFNTSFRAPNLAENFSPLTQTFANGFVDPCATASIQGLANLDQRAFRIANCTALAAAKGLSYDFSGTGTPLDNSDDYIPTYPSGIAGLNGGNIALQPETSESFTFTAGFQPRFIPNFSLVLDYYEIEIKDVIAAVTAQAAANSCVTTGPTLNASACNTIFRNNTPIVGGVTAQERSEAFEVGSPGNTGVGFIQGSINFAKLQTRGLDFTARYRIDTEEMFGKEWGQLNYAIRGSWLIEQKNFTDVANRNAFGESASEVNFPRVRFTSTLTWVPNDRFQVSWIADWQAAQDIVRIRDQVNNPDNRATQYFDTGNYMRNDLTARFNLNDELTLRAGITNIFDAEQPEYFGTGFIDNMDPYGRRFNIGLNWRPF